MLRVVLILVATILGSVLATTCSDGFPGRCEMNEPDCICDGGWAGIDPCRGLGRNGRCCRYPVPCKWPGFGSGTCIPKYSVKCPQGNRFADVGDACPANYWCCVKPDYRPYEPCNVPGLPNGYCVWPEDTCMGKRSWGPCGLYRQCCTSPSISSPPPTYGPPAPTHKGTPTGPTDPPPPPKEGLYALFPLKAAQAYLAGWDSSVEFRAAAHDLEVQSVEFRLNGVRVGDGTVCNGNDWCFTLNFKQVTGSSVLSAVPDNGPSVSYQIPLIKPGFLLRFLTGKVTDVASWSGRFTEKWIDEKGSSGVAIPLIGFTHSYETAVTTTVQLSYGGSITMSGAGSRSDTFKPDCCEGASGSFTATVSLQSSLVDIGGLVSEPQITSASFGMAGSITMPTVYQFSKEVEAFGVSIGVSCGIDVILGTSVTLGFIRDANNDFFGLPVQLHSVTGTIISIGANAQAKANAGPLSAGVTASVTMGPIVQWTQSSGMTWKGISVNAKIGVNVDYFFSSTSITILSLTDTINLKRGTYNPDVVVKISDFSRITNAWNPTVTSYNAPYRVENVYPSAFTGAASVGGYDLMLWSSFDHARDFPHNLHVQYTVRGRNGTWSQPMFIGGSSTSVGMPALEDIESRNQLLLVASQVTRAHPDEGTFEARLVHSYFDLLTQTWSPYTPMFDSHPTDAIDWLPIFSEDGEWVAFIRATRDAERNTYGKLMASHWVNGRWSSPEVIVEDSNPLVSFSIDSDTHGTAMLAYRTRHTSKVNLCFHTPSRTASEPHWACRPTDFDVDPSSTPNLVAINHGYLLVWNVASTINTVKLAPNGTVLDQHPLTLPNPISTLVTTVCDLAGEGSVVVGWTSWGDETTFAYALADPSGKLFHSHNNVAPSIDTTSKTIFNRGSMQLAWTGTRLLYAVMLNDNSTGVPRGTFASFDLNFDAIAHIHDPIFDPADFSAPLVTVSATLTNNGLRSIAAGGQVVYSFVTPAGAEYAIGSSPLTKDLMSGESFPVSVVWNTTVNTTEGGMLRFSFFGSDTTIADEPLVTDPATYGVDNITITSGKTERSTAVSGLITVNGPAVGEVEIQAWTRLDDGHLMMLGSITHRTRPRSREAFLLPLTNLYARFDDLQVRVIGKHSKTTLHTTAHDSRYDFLLLLQDVTVVRPSTAEDKFVVTVPVRNFGTEGATVSLRARRLDVSTGASQDLALVNARVEGNSVTNVTVHVSLPMRLNMVMFEVNSDDQPLPELNTDNNQVLLSLQNQQGIQETPENDWTTVPIVSSPAATTIDNTPTDLVDESLDEKLSAHHQSRFSRRSIILIAVVAFCAIFALAAIVAAIFLLLVGKQMPSESPYYVMPATSK